VFGTHEVCNGVHTDVSLRRAHGGWGNSKDLLDSLTGHAKFTDNLLVGEGGEESVRPGVDADFVTGHVLFDQNGRSLNDTRADNEEGGLDILVIKVFEQFSAKRAKLDVWDSESLKKTHPV
jgi:hypothetical protein